MCLQTRKFDKKDSSLRIITYCLLTFSDFTRINGCVPNEHIQNYSLRIFEFDRYKQRRTFLIYSLTLVQKPLLLNYVFDLYIYNIKNVKIVYTINERRIKIIWRITLRRKGYKENVVKDKSESVLWDQHLRGVFLYNSHHKVE